MLAASPLSQQGAEDPLTSEVGTLKVWLIPNTDSLGALLKFRTGYRKAG